ncbi:hypothetical protein L0Y40_00540 [Candidatus Wolfebacteria bacterium]|nr:hypothetical protein [Candidatus Wolfebacteria bacterium]
MTKGQIIGVIVVVFVIAAGAVVANKGGFGGGRAAPDTDDLGGANEGGAFGEVAENECQARCDRLDREIEEKRMERVREIIEGSGCSLGSGGDFTGTMNWQGADFEYACPNQSSAESLGEAIADAKENRSRLDREIDDLEKEKEANCPCFVRLVPCADCRGVPPNGLCPTLFVTPDECSAIGGIPSPN